MKNNQEKDGITKYVQESISPMKKLLILLLVSVFFMGCVAQKQPEPVYNNSVLPEYSPVVDMAKQDLSQRLNIQIENIQLVSEEAVNWSDTSLGFPEQGMSYAQVITPGFKIILKTGDRLFEYHSDYKRVVGPKEI